MPSPIRFGPVLLLAALVSGCTAVEPARTRRMTATTIVTSNSISVKPR